MIKLFCIRYKTIDEEGKQGTGVFFCYALSEMQAQARFVNTKSISYRNIETVREVKEERWDY